MSSITKITLNEFFQLFQKCMPPSGWPTTLTIGNSGGPDSVCLMFLLSSLLAQGRGTQGLPSRLVSLHINHNWQESANDMATRAEKYANNLGILNLTSTVDWSDPLYAPRPTLERFETVARNIRRHKFFQGMSASKSTCLALAHHSDDQAETSIMRLMGGSGSYGASGMRRVRRWGMGLDENKPVEYFGAAGVERYQVRPLIEVSKDRMLATCQANGLEYVTDTTNFQPDITVRNHVRHVLSSLKKNPGTSYQRVTQSIPNTDSAFVAREKQIMDTIKTLDPECKPQAVSVAIHNIGVQIERDETAVTEFLRKYLIPAPPSTMLLTLSDLHSITDHSVRLLLIRRILRYVSPHPWGSPKAEANGSSTRFEAMIRTIWNSTPSISTGGFSHGSKVFWRPVVLLPNGSVRFKEPEGPSEKIAWLISREPPYPGRVFEQSLKDPLTVDITSRMFEALNTRNTEPLQILYDGRFILSMSHWLMEPELVEILANPHSGARLLVLPDTKYFFPKLILRQNGEKDRVISRMELHSGDGSKIDLDDRRRINWTIVQQELKMSRPWVTPRLARTWNNT
ncbi:hypothetical protein ABKN59_004015 [Abortiporus biennis]